MRVCKREVGKAAIRGIKLAAFVLNISFFSFSHFCFLALGRLLEVWPAELKLGVGCLEQTGGVAWQLLEGGALDLRFGTAHLGEPVLHLLHICKQTMVEAIMNFLNGGQLG